VSRGKAALAVESNRRDRFTLLDETFQHGMDR
jgi:hypothetical protein